MGVKVTLVLFPADKSTLTRTRMLASRPSTMKLCGISVAALVIFSVTALPALTVISCLA